MPIKLFTQFRTFRITGPLELNLDLLQEALGRNPARQPDSQELSAYGFKPPLGVAGELVEQVRSGVFYLVTQKVERILPGSVVRDALAEKVAEIEDQQSRKVYAKERGQIRDEVIQALLPRAFLRTTETRALICPPYIYIDQGSARRCEDLLSALRECLGSLPVCPVTSQVRIAVNLTAWVQGDSLSETSFSRGESFQSRGTCDESQRLSGKQVDLSESYILEALSGGQEVVRLGLNWEPIDLSYTVPFTVDESLAVKSVKWGEEMSLQVDSAVGDDADPITTNRATLLLLSNTIPGLMADLLGALGGEQM